MKEEEKWEKKNVWKKWAAGNVWCDVSCYLLGEKMAIKSQLWWLGKVGEKKEKWGRLSQWWNDNWERQQVKWQLSQCWNILAGCSIFEYLKNIFGISLQTEMLKSPVCKLKLKSWNIFFQNCKKTLFADSPRTQASSSLWLDKVRGGEQIITREQNGIMWSKQKRLTSFSQLLS